nr:MAG TPA: hypothetical protein [Caudoviricetes sp.]
MLYQFIDVPYVNQPLANGSSCISGVSQLANCTQSLQPP